jgi:hypothetical protein
LKIQHLKPKKLEEQIQEVQPEDHPVDRDQFDGAEALDFAEEDEQDDEVFPLPNASEKERTLSRNRVSVKDLSKSFEEKIEKTTIEESKTRKKFDQRRPDKKKTSGKQSNVSDAYPYTPLDAGKRQWIVAASKNDEVTLKRLMTNDASIVRTRDPTTGYTALHWAARSRYCVQVYLWLKFIYYS